MRHILIIIIVILGFSISSKAQVAANALLGLPNAITSDINLTTPAIGSMVYNTDDGNTYIYTGSKFEKLLIGLAAYNGTFKIDAAGTKTITGLPFRPTTIVFEAYGNVEDFVLDSDNAGSENDYGIINSFGYMHGFARNDNGTITEQVIYNGASGTSVNDISRYASDSNCLGIRYSHQNGNDLGKITGTLDSFNTDGFTLDITYTLGTLTINDANPILDVQPEDINTEEIIIIYTAYR